MKPLDDQISANFPHCFVAYVRYDGVEQDAFYITITDTDGKNAESVTFLCRILDFICRARIAACSA